MTRLRSFRTLEQRQILEMRARLWRDGLVVREESGSLAENLWFAQEVLQGLALAGFADVSMEAAHSGAPATDDDGVVVFVARA
jgi:hypothetical protein